MPLKSGPDRASLAAEKAAVRREASLRRIATLVAGGVTAGELFSAVAREVSVVLDAPVVTVDRYELEGGSPVSVVLAALEDAQFPVGSRWPLDGPGARAWIYETRRPVRIEDFSGLESTAAAAARQQGMSWVVGAPIIVDGAVWGNICAGTTEDEPIPDDAESRLADFTELVSTAIANSDAREKVGSLLDEQEALRRMATLVARGVSPSKVLRAAAVEVGRLLDADVAMIERYEPDGATTVVASYGSIASDARVGRRAMLEGESVAMSIKRTGRSARMEGYDDVPGSRAARARALGIRFAVGAPITVEGRLWGVMIASWGRRDSALARDAESRMAGFTELLGTAIANADSRAELAASEARARELASEQAALRRVATLVARAPASEQFFSSVAREVAGVLNVQGVLVDRFEADGTIVTVGFEFDSDLSGAERVFGIGTRMPPDPGSLAAQVFETHRAARVDDFSTLAGTIGDLARAAGLGSGCGGPIVVNGDVWGLMCVFSRKGTVLPVGTEDRLDDFIELVATAIANHEARADLAASEARARQLAEEQAALRRVATLVATGVRPLEIFSAVSEEVGRVFGSHYSGVGRFEPDGSAVVIVGVSAGIGNIPTGTRWPLEDFLATTAVYRTGRPARNERSAWEDDSGPVANSLRELGLVSTVAAPITVEGNVWGVITVSDAHHRLPPDAEDRLAAFTELVASAIGNAESRAKLAASEARAHELAREQAALRRVATLVAQGASPDEVFSAVAEEVAGVIDVPVVGIRRYEADGTFTVLGNAGDTPYAVGSRWPVVDEGITGVILATGRPVRKDGWTSSRLGPPDDAAPQDQWSSSVGVPIVVEGSIWGFIGATDKSGRTLPADTEERLARFTELIATAVSNATTRTELLSSRARVVSASDETRRRLERDLHDGIQQWLVALALKARKAAGLSATDESAVRELSGLADDLVAVTDELRELSRGIHPAILSDAGLDDALEALARRSAIRVDLDVSFQRRYDPALEATVYYIAAESITNAVKHARASTVTVHGGRRGGTIEFEIKDDGVGGADPRRGTGLIGLKDRVDTLGGTISIASPAGAGTTIRVKLPAGGRDGEDPPPARSAEAASAPASG